MKVQHADIWQCTKPYATQDGRGLGATSLRDRLHWSKVWLLTQLPLAGSLLGHHSLGDSTQAGEGWTSISHDTSLPQLGSL